MLGTHSCLFFFFLMIRRPPRSTLDRSSAASDVYKRQVLDDDRVEVARGQLVGGDRRVLIDGGGAQARLRGPQDHRVELLVLGDGAAVSYTHLRAHETVLDIVCRLLLEKKKNKHQSYTRASTAMICKYSTEARQH